MTYQSFPNRPIIFPDQAAHLNHFGVQPLKGNYVKHADFDEGPSSSWRNDAHRMAMARVQNSKSMEHKMLQGPPSVKGVKSYLTKRYIGGAKTVEGERMVGNLLKDRVQQYNDIASASFDVVSPERVASITPQSDTYALDSLFSNLLTSIDEGVISKTLLSTISSITNTLVTTGDKLSAEKLGEYSQTLADLSRAVENLSSNSEFYISQKDQTILTSVKFSVKKLFNFIKRLEAYAGAPTKTRAIALAGERAKLLALTRQSLTTELAERPIPTPAPGWESTVQSGRGFRK